MELPTKEQVFGARTTPKSTRRPLDVDTSQVYRAQSQTADLLAGAASRAGAAGVRAGEAVSERGKMYQRASDDMDVLIQKRKEAADNIALQKAKSYTLAATTDLMDRLKQDPDYKTTTDKYANEFNTLRENALSMVPEDQRELFSYALQDINTKDMSSLKQHIYDRDGDAQHAGVIENETTTADLVNKSFAEGDISKGMAALSTQEKMYDNLVASGVIDATTAAQKKAAFREATINDAVNSIPEDVAYNAIASATGSDKMSIISSVREKSEGGFVAVDGASGQPAVYGINRKYHPAEFDLAMAITEEKGESAGKAYADNFYAKEYWDKNNLSDYQPDVAKVLFDGAINHGSAFRKKMLDAAKDGASASEIISMRREEYARLAKSPEYKPSLAGWNARLDKLSMDTSNSKNTSALLAMLPPDKKQKIIDDTTKNHVVSSIAKDPSTALLGLENGTLGVGLDAATIETYKADARTAQDKAFENAEKSRLSAEVVKNKADWDNFIGGTMKPVDIQRYENKHGETPFSRMAKAVVIKKPPERTAPEKLTKYTEIMDRLATIKTNAGMDPTSAVSSKNAPSLSASTISDFKVLQDDIYAAVEGGFIESSEAQSFINQYSEVLNSALSPEDAPATVGEQGTGFLGFFSDKKLDDPYNYGWKTVKSELEKAGLETDLASRRQLFELYTSNFGKLDEKGNLIQTGIYESTGNEKNDKKMLDMALKNAIEEYNRSTNPALRGVEKLPNAIIPKSAATVEIPVVSSPEEAMKLPSGTTFKTPDGKIKVRP